MTKGRTFLLAGLMSTVFLYACGGGSDPTPNILNPGNVNNGELKGRVMLGNDGWILDLATGIYSRIPGMEQWDDNPDYLGIARVSAFPVAYTGSEVIETVEECRNIQGLSSNEHCVKIHDQNATLLKHINYRGNIITDAKLSRNREYVAIARQYGAMTSDSYLEIHDRNGIIVSSNIVDDTYASLTFDWLPNSRLVYTFKQSIYLTTSLSTVGIPVITFTADQGVPDDVAASPDGTQLAFQLRTSGSFAADRGHIWVVNIDGSGLRQLTDIPPSDNDPAVDNPAWSPDGQWILAVEGRVHGQGSTAPGSRGVLYAIPSNGERVLLTPDGSTPAQPIFSYNGMIHGIRDPELSYDFLSNGNHAWLP